MQIIKRTLVLIVIAFNFFGLKNVHNQVPIRAQSQTISDQLDSPQEDITITTITTDPQTPNTRSSDKHIDLSQREEKNEPPPKIKDSHSVRGEIVDIISEGQESFGDKLLPYQELKIKILTSGSQNTGNNNNQPEYIEIKHSAQQMGLESTNYQQYEVGDKVIISVNYDYQNQAKYNITGKTKISALIALGILFVFATVLIGRKWGALSLFGLIISFLIIFALVLPLIKSGFNPIWASLIGSILIIPITFYISHGFNKKTHVAVISTFIGLFVTILLAFYFTDQSNLTGHSSEEANFIAYLLSGKINLKALMMAGIIISSLGVLDDISIGQASLIKQLHQAQPEADCMTLFKQGMKVGQDHISSMVNTLILVYSGSSLPLLLLFFDSQRSFIDIIELEIVAEEIVTMLITSIGLILTAPVATLIASWMFNKKKNKL